MQTDTAFAIALVVLAGTCCQWFAWRVKLPAILFLLLAGILAGPVTGWLDPDRLFGNLLFPFISLSVALILFEGSLSLRFHQIAGLRRVVRNLVSLGVVVTWLSPPWPPAGHWIFPGSSRFSSARSPWSPAPRSSFPS